MSEATELPIFERTFGLFTDHVVEYGDVAVMKQYRELLAEHLERVDKAIISNCDHEWAITLISGWIASKRICMRCGKEQFGKFKGETYTSGERMPHEWIDEPEDIVIGW